MPKRKRDDISLDALIPRLRTDIFHALKQAKGFERQRQSKRLSDPKTAPEKKARIENEIVVLKSLDLQQTAHAHLCTSLLKVKAVADSADRLPAEVRAGVPKPDLTEEERAALHNVTSSLYNRVEVRRAVEKAIEAVCRSIGVPVPDKKGKGKKEKEGKAGEKVDGTKTDGGVGKKEKKKADQAEEREGHEARDQEPGKSEKKKGQKKTDTSEQPAGSDADEEEEEKAISQLDKMLGLESDEESPGEEEELLVKGRVRKPSSKELDPMEITTDEDASEDEDLDPMEVTSDEEGDSDSEDEFDGFSDDVEGQQSSASDDEDASDASSSASSVSRSPPPKKVKGKGALKPTDSTFLPSLMGGYISGSESASDIDIAPQRKNRRGQRARQALWEKKYGEKAKHLQQGAKGRDSGWDAKRGAVDGDSKPWKRGIRNPLLDKSKGSGANETQLGPEKKKPAPRKRDDTGPLHPSWEAKRKAKEKQQLSAPFQGKKITFD